MDLTIASLSPILIAVAALLICLTVHEFSHALAAYVQGDTTARDAGSLSIDRELIERFAGRIVIHVAFQRQPEAGEAIGRVMDQALSWIRTVGSSTGREIAGASWSK